MFWLRGSKAWALVRPLCVAMILALVGSLLATTNAQAISMQDLQQQLSAQTAAPVPASQTAPAATQKSGFRTTETPAFALNTQARSDSRLGGSGATVAQLVRRKGARQTVTNLQVRLQGPAGSKITSVKSVGWARDLEIGLALGVSASTRGDVRPKRKKKHGWQCTLTKTGGALCRFVDPLRGAATPPTLRTTIATPSTKGSTAKVVGRATWTQTVASKSGERVVKTLSQGLTNSTDLVVNPRLSVAVAGANGDKLLLQLNKNGKAGRGLVTGKVANVRGEQVVAKWQQIAGPKVTLLGKPTTSAVQGTISQQFTMPSKTRNGAKVRFRLTVSGQGQTVSAARTMSVQKRATGYFEPHNYRFHKLASRSKVKRKTHGRKDRHNLLNGVVNSSATQVFDIDSDATLTVSDTPSPVASVAWSVVDGDPNIFDGATTTANSISFRTPQESTVVTVVANATMQNGRVTPITQTVVVTEADVMPSPVDADDTTTVCGLTAGDTVTFNDTSTMTLPTDFKVPTDCQWDTKIEFSGATMTYAGNSWTAMEGSVSPETGFVLTKGSLASIPAKLKPYLLDYTDLTASDENPVQAQIEDGVWQSWKGSFDLPMWVSFLPAPDGWGKVSGTVSFTAEEDEQDPDKETPKQEFSAGTHSTDDTAGGMVFTFNIASGVISVITVNAKNLVQLPLESGVLSFSGETQFSLADSGNWSVELSATCPATGNDPPPSSCALIGGDGSSGQDLGLWLNSAKIKLNHETSNAATNEITLGAGLTVAPSSGNPYAFEVEGVYKSTKEWSLSLTQASDTQWDLPLDMKLSGINGKLAYVPITTKSGVRVEAEASELRFALAGSVSGLVSDDFTINKAGGSITNECPDDAPKGTCTDGDVRLVFDVGITANIIGQVMTLAAQAEVNVKTGVFKAAVNISGVQVGPDELNVQSASFTISNKAGAVGTCVPQGKSPPEGLALEVSATGAALGKTFNLSGSLNQSGYCLYARFGAYTAGAFAADDSTMIAYTSYPKGAKLTYQDGEATKEKVLEAQVLALTGTIQMPDAVKQGLKVSTAQVEFSASVNTATHSFAASATLVISPQTLVGNTNQLAMQFTSFGLGFQVDTVKKESALSVTLGGQLVGRSDPNDAGTAWVTPLYGTAKFTFGARTSISIEVGVDTRVVQTSCPAPDQSDICVQNAFGQQGLYVKDLAIRAGYDVTSLSPSFAFNASAYLPSSWTTGILIGQPNVALGFELSAASPCISFSVGSENGPTVVDLGGVGAVTASYVNLVIAPAGCTLPGAKPTTILPGLAFAFNGSLLGFKTDIALKLTVNAKGPKLNGHLNLGEFAINGLEMDQVQFSFDIDIETSKYKINFCTDDDTNQPIPDCGRIALGNGQIGGYVTMAGKVDIDPAAKKWYLNFSGAGAFNIVVINASLVNFKLLIDSTGSFGFGGDMRVGVLGTELIGGVNFIVSDGLLLAFHIDVGVAINVFVGALSGSAYIDYCRGTLSVVNGRTNSASCSTVKDTGASTRARIALAGTVRVLWWDKDYEATILDTTNMTNPPTPKLDKSLNLKNPGNLTQFAGTSPDKYNRAYMWNQSSTIGYVYDGSVGRTLMVNSVAPKSFTPSDSSPAVPACPSPTTGMNWTPSEQEPNPPTTNLPPITQPCGVQVVYSTLTDTAPSMPWTGPSWSNGSVAPGDWDAFVAATSEYYKNGDVPDGRNPFNTPQSAYVRCAPNTLNTCAIDLGGGNVPLILNGATYANSTGTPDQALSTAADAGYVQVLDNLINPLGVLPSGVSLRGQTALWSPDGKTVFFTGSNYLQAKTTALTNNVSAYPNIGYTPMAKILGVDGVSRPTGLELDATGYLDMNLADGSTLSPYASGVKVKPGDENQPYLFVENGVRLWSDEYCAPADWYSLCGSGDDDAMVLRDVKTNLCIEGKGAEFVKGDQLITRGCANHPSLAMRLDNSVYNSAGGGQIRLGNDTGLCMDAYGGGTGEGVPVVAWPCSASNTRWVMGTTGTLQQVGSSNCLWPSVGGSGDPKLLTWGCQSTNPMDQWNRQGITNF